MYLDEVLVHEALWGGGSEGSDRSSSGGGSKNNSSSSMRVLARQNAILEEEEEEEEGKGQEAPDETITRATNVATGSSSSDGSQVPVVAERGGRISTKDGNGRKAGKNKLIRQKYVNDLYRQEVGKNKN